MSDQFWLTKARLKRIEPFFPRTSGIPRGRPACGQRDSPCDLEWSAMAGCARGLWTGGVSQCATTAAPTHPSALSASW
jgi:hypothetical protein